ncbi:MAG: hypothetical protein HRU28_18380, partial [Rhizobiales bacterium]|nr:hypothetical protein [Hyphomicrobiales bacterium]
MKNPDFEISYNQLSDTMFAITQPEPAPSPQYFWLNTEFGKTIGMDEKWLNSSS